ncbi:MAG: UvrD-helicase domain-containing protein [Ilumatobacteraceae bacterium]
MAARKKPTGSTDSTPSSSPPPASPPPVPPAPELQLTDPLPKGRLVVEASAGTGKTYSLTAFVVRHLAEGPLAPSDILVVTFTRAAAAELRDRMRRGLLEARAALAADTPPASSDWLSTVYSDDAEVRQERRDRLDLAIANFDEATISTIHGFCQQALSQLGLRSGSLLDSELADSTAEIVDEVCRDLLVRELWQRWDALSWKESKTSRADPAAVLSRLADVVKARIGNPLIAVLPSDSDLQHLQHGDEGLRIAAWVHLVDEAVDEVQQRRRARRELGYDDLVSTLHRALTEGPQASAVATTLRDRYSLVLVDEFQDTDPLQWAIFETAFIGDLVTVGDPKQAIYRFRGADIHAYLDATATGTKRSLRTNYRSDADLVTATNVLVEGVPLGMSAITAEAVKAPGHAPARALSGGTPLWIRQLRLDPSIATNTGDKVSAPMARRAILADLVAVIVEMLDNHRLHSGEAAERALSPGDIAVLVPSHSNADEVVRALGSARIPAVRARTGSVFATPAAEQWRLLLAALERPSHAPTVRAAALGVFFHCDPASIDPSATASGETETEGDAGDLDVVTSELQRQCADWAQRMVDRPFLAWFDDVRSSSGVVEHLLSRADGERTLTDLDHIAELLATGSNGGRLDATTARRHLDALVAAAASMGEDDAQMRRIDSDATAVQVSTIHGSKGLEYPVVLLPFSWTSTSARGARVYNEESGRRVIDVASSFEWDGPGRESRLKARKHWEEVGRQGDQLRLMYVALTRAEHRTIVWVTQTGNSPKSALNLILFDRDDAGLPKQTAQSFSIGVRGGVNATVPKADVTDGEAAAHLETLQQRSGGTISVMTCPPNTPHVEWMPGAGSDAGLPVLAIADPGACAPHRRWWGRWSFSAIHSSNEYHGTAPAHADAAVAGGTDEPADSTQPVDVLAPATGGAAAAAPLQMPLADMVAGTRFGTLVHDVLERVDPTTEPLEAHLRAEINRALGRDRMALDRTLLEAGLAAAIRTPLGTIAGGRSLADIPVRDRLAELDFELALCGGTASIAARQIGDVLLRTLPSDDPQRAYADMLAAGRFSVDIGGYLRGSIDAVLRVDVGGVMRHLVVDYKTNRLHRRGDPNPMAAYHPSLLPAAMAASDYVLQGLLYTVAVHRFLRGRLAGYDPSLHLGGIAYLYVRGMIGPDTPATAEGVHGVFAWTPPVGTVLALDALLATEGAS